LVPDTVSEVLVATTVNGCAAPKVRPGRSMLSPPAMFVSVLAKVCVPLTGPSICNFASNGPEKPTVKNEPNVIGPLPAVAPAVSSSVPTSRVVPPV
jgi:hypothetical protein